MMRIANQAFTNKLLPLSFPKPHLPTRFFYRPLPPHCFGQKKSMMHSPNLALINKLLPPPILKSYNPVRFLYHPLPPHSKEYIEAQYKDLQETDPDLFKKVRRLYVKEGTIVYGLELCRQGILDAMFVSTKINTLFKSAEKNKCAIYEFRVKADTECLGIEGKVNEESNTYYMNGARLGVVRKIERRQLNQKDENKYHATPSTT
jgi:hypothetical protein